MRRTVVAVLLVMLAAIAVARAGRSPSGQTPSAAGPAIGSRSIPVLTIDGHRFRDLNRNGRLDAYEDWWRPGDARVADLVARMSLEEKAASSPALRPHPRDWPRRTTACRRSPSVPTIVAISLDRPAVLTNVRDKAAAMIGTFGASDAALLDVVTGRARAEGRLPFALPRSMADVEAQSPGRPHDLASPLYPFGWPR